MELIITQPVPVFDLSQIKRGDLLYGKHYSWDEGKAGFVTAATEKTLTIQYHPGIGNVTNHFHIPVDSVIAGDWEIRWSMDMSQIYEYGSMAEDEEQAGNESKTEGNNESGGIDL